MDEMQQLRVLLLNEIMLRGYLLIVLLYSSELNSIVCYLYSFFRRRISAAAFGVGGFFLTC